MTVDDARAAALSMPGAIESAHHGHPDFRREGKIFATLWPDQGRSVLRLPMPEAEALETSDGVAFRLVSRSGGAGWVSVQLEHVDRERFDPLVEIAWLDVAKR